MDLQQDKNSFDSIIDQHFPKDIQQKRIKKELVSLNELDTEYFKVSLQNTAIGLKVIVELSNELIEMEVEDPRNLKLPAVFELLLDSQFPFNLPRLFTRTPIYEPSLADARDYLEDVMQRPWSPTILLKEVITQLPKFLKRLNELPRWEDSQSVGKYHPGELYSLEDLIGLESVNLFTGEEVLQESGQTSPRYLGIVESFFLKFEPTEKTRTIVKLLLWSPIRSIVNVKKGLGDDKSLILTFVDKEKKSGFGQNKFVMNESSKFLKLVMDMGLKYNVGIGKALRDNLDLSQYIAKQTPRNRKEKIEELLQAITAFEVKMETELNKELIYGLMGLYQKVVEHFATHEDPMFEDFVGRLRNLMERQDIQTALRNEQQSPSNANQQRLHDHEEEEKQGRPIKQSSPVVQQNHKEEEKSEEEEDFEGYQQREQEFIGGNVGNREQERVKSHHASPTRDEEEREYEQYQQKQEEFVGGQIENREEEKPQHHVEEREVEARDEEEREYEEYQQKQEEFVGGQVGHREEEPRVREHVVVEEGGVEPRDEEERAYEEYQKQEPEELGQNGDREPREEDDNMFKVEGSEGNEERRSEHEGENKEHIEEREAIEENYETVHEEKQEEQIHQKEEEEINEEEKKTESDKEQKEDEGQEERIGTEENMFKLEENNEQKEEQEQEEVVKEEAEEGHNQENNVKQHGEEEGNVHEGGI